MEDFYITLPSSVKNPQFENTSSRYVTRLPQVLQLERDRFGVAVTDIIYPYSFVNVGRPLNYWIHLKSGETPFKIQFPSAQYHDLPQIVATLNSEVGPRRGKRSAPTPMDADFVSAKRLAEIDGRDKRSTETDAANSVIAKHLSVKEQKMKADELERKAGNIKIEQRLNLSQADMDEQENKRKEDLAMLERAKVLRTQLAAEAKKKEQNDAAFFAKTSVEVALAAERKRLEEVRKAEEEAQKSAKEAEDARKTAEEARRRAEDEQKRRAKQAEDDAIMRDAEDARKAEEEAQKKEKEAEDALKAEELARQRAKEAEDARKAAEEDARKAKAAEDARKAKEAEDARKAKAAEDARKAKEAEDARKAKEAEDARKAKEAEDAQAAEDARKAKEAEDLARLEAHKKVQQAQINRHGQIPQTYIDNRKDTQQQVLTHGQAVIQGHVDIRQQDYERKSAKEEYREIAGLVYEKPNDKNDYAAAKQLLEKIRSKLLVQELRDARQYLRFSERDGRIHLEFADPDILFVEFEQPCAYFLGFHDTIVRESGVAPSKVDMFGNVSTIYLYCDIIDPIIVGDQKNQLLSVIPCRGSYGEMIHHTIPYPRYLPIMNNTVDSIKVEFLSEFAEPIRFNWGSTIIVLHFKKIE